MNTISSENLPKVLELRKKNGLEATEAAANADLEASKAKWTEEDTPRYRRAGESPIYVSGKYLTKTGVCPATGEKEEGRASASAPATGAKRGRKEASKGTEVNEKDFYLALHKKGFKVAILRNEITGELTSEIPAAVKALDFQFGGEPSKLTDAIHISQTSPQVLVTLTLDKFLELVKIKP